MFVKTKRTSWQVLALVVCVAVLTLTCQVAAHWHGSDYKDPHCQICHLSHAASFVLVSVAALYQPLAVTSTVAPTPLGSHQKLFASQGFSRAPPA